jgi:hypothetical protein
VNPMNPMNPMNPLNHDLRPYRQTALAKPAPNQYITIAHP